MQAAFPLPRSNPLLAVAVPDLKGLFGTIMRRRPVPTAAPSTAVHIERLSLSEGTKLTLMGSGYMTVDDVRRAYHESPSRFRGQFTAADQYFETLEALGLD